MKKIHTLKENIFLLAMQACLFGSTVLLTFYLIEYGICSGTFPFFYRISNIAAFGDMLAIFVLSGSLVCYEHASAKVSMAFYIIMMMIAVAAVSIYGNGVAMTLMLFIPLFMTSFVGFVAERIKRLLQVFFGEAFLFTNMSLLFSGSSFIHTQGAVYSLESSLVGDFVLAIFALFVMNEWDKLSQKEDVSQVSMCRLIRKCRKALLLCVLLLLFSLVIGWEIGAWDDNITVSFMKEDGTVVETGIFTSVVCKLFYGINKGLRQAISGNIIALFAAKAGYVGIVRVATILIYLGFTLYRRLQYLNTEGDVWDLIAVVGMVQLIVLPVSTELIPIWCVYIFFSAVRTTCY